MQINIETQAYASVETDALVTYVFDKEGKFDGVLSETGKTLDELRAYVAEHPELKHALYKVPHRHGIAGTAAQFAWHVSDLINKDAAYRRRARVPAAAQQRPDPRRRRAAAVRGRGVSPGG